MAKSYVAYEVQFSPALQADRQKQDVALGRVFYSGWVRLKDGRIAASKSATVGKARGIKVGKGEEVAASLVQAVESTPMSSMLEEFRGLVTEDMTESWSASLSEASGKKKRITIDIEVTPAQGRKDGQAKVTTSNHGQLAIAIAGEAILSGPPRDRTLYDFVKKPLSELLSKHPGEPAKAKIVLDITVERWGYDTVVNVHSSDGRGYQVFLDPTYRKELSSLTGKDNVLYWLVRKDAFEMSQGVR